MAAYLRKNTTDIDVVLATSWMYPHVGGVSTHMMLLARALGIAEPRILSFQHIVRQPESIWGRGGRIVKSKLRGESITAHAERMIQLLQQADCEILHCHDAMATWAAGVARERYRKRYRIVSTVHGPVSRHMVEHGSDPSSAEVRAVETRERMAWQMADAIIAVDSTQRDICVSQQADSAKIEVIANAVDLDEIDAKLKLLQLKRDDDVHWLLLPRRLAPKNGVTHAIGAMRFLPPEVKLWLAGDGIEEEACRKLVREYRLDERVAFLGGVPRDVILMLSSIAAATLIPSVPSNGVVEATSIAAIEAMACRVPVVASSIGGLVELINDDSNGFLVSPGDPEQLAAAVRNILRDGASIQQIVENARLRVEQRYSTPVWMAAIRQVYERVLSSPIGN